MSKVEKAGKGVKKKMIEALIREFPDKKNKELVTIFRLRAEGTDMTIRDDAQEIASIRSALKKAGDTPGTEGSEGSKAPATASKPARKNAINPTTARGTDSDLVSGSELLDVKAVADRVGGLAKLKAALALLEQLQQ